MMLPRAALACSLALACGCHTRVTPPADLGAEASDMAHGPVDLAEPDMARVIGGDLAMRDLAMPSDLATPDLSGPADLSAIPDLTTLTFPDLARLPDLSMTMGDLAMPDLAKPVDFAGVDLACAMACNSPPPAQCNGSNVVTYPQNGSCTNGVCAYTPMSSACMYGCYKAACTAALSFAGNVAAFTSMGGQAVSIGPNNPGSAPSNDTISVISQSYPHGAASDVHLIWATDVNYANQKDILMTFDKEVGNNDQWFGIIPAQAAGTQVFFYVRTDGMNVQPFYAPGGFGNNYTYKTQ